jgi:hypothetical protein
VLGPNLFNLFIDDIPKPPDVTAHLYADDTAYLASSMQANIIVQKLQNVACIVEEWCSKWRVQMNPDKTIAVCFTPSSKQKFIPKTKINFLGVNIPWSSEVTYLGVTLDKKLKYTNHIKNRINKAQAARHILNPLLISKQLSIRSKRTLYISILRPMLLYASEIWLTTSQTNIKKIEQFQAKVLRKITNLPYFVRNNIIRNDLNLNTINEYILKMAKRFYNKPNNDNNSTLKEALDYDQKVFMEFKARPKQIIQLYNTSSDEN